MQAQTDIPDQPVGRGHKLGGATLGARALLDQRRAKASALGLGKRVAADFRPGQVQETIRNRPLHIDASARHCVRTVFAGVGGHLVHHHRHMERLLRHQLHRRAACGKAVRVQRAEFQLVTHDLAQRCATPGGGAQQGMRLGKRLDAPREGPGELLRLAGMP